MNVSGKYGQIRGGRMLTNKQTELVQKYWKRGWFWASDIVSVFSSVSAKTACISRLLILGIIKEESFKLIINRERFLEYQAEFENKKLDEYERNK